MYQMLNPDLKNIKNNFFFKNPTLCKMDPKKERDFVTVVAL